MYFRIFCPFFITSFLVLAAVCILPAIEKQVSSIRITFERCQSRLEAKSLELISKHYNDVGSSFGRITKLVPDRLDEYCSAERFNLLRSLNLLKENVDQCLSESTKYLTEFLYKSFESFTDFTCEQNGNNILKLVNASRSECFSNLSKTTELNSVDVCIQKVHPLGETKVTKPELCDEISVTRKCLAEFLNKQCNDDFRAHEKLYNDLFDSISTPCSSDGSSRIASNCCYFVILFVFVLKYFMDNP